ncbi:MAG TPA: hypothetical protein VKS82_21700 [Streptosporangiaceae bacterium]|nr:hypothetical protein [Streptosporangiaceae bacterium]
MLAAQLRFWRTGLSTLLPGRHIAAQFTVFRVPPLSGRITGTVLPALHPLPGNAALTEDPGHSRGRGYYPRGAIRLAIGAVDEACEVGDGGFTGWTARPMNGAKERCLITGVATERRTS